jgi:hypothetical protein
MITMAEAKITITTRARTLNWSIQLRMGWNSPPTLCLVSL